MKLFRKLFLITTLITSILFLSCNFLYQQDKYAGFISEEQLNNYIQTNTVIPDGTKMLGANGATVVFLTTTGVGTWTVPADWNSANNSIEVIGGGGNAAGWTGQSGGGGGGGAYSKKNNLTLISGASVSYQVGGASTDTYFKSSSDVLAKGGVSSSNATGASGGLSSLCVGDVKYSGGNGGNGGSANDGAGGGGGAAGRNGVGNNGGDGSIGAYTGGNGGQGNLTFGGTGGIGSSGANATVGGNGSEWDATHGTGGGGGGGRAYGPNQGANGGLYGGGGGGGAYNGGAGSSGMQGLIIITYTPATSNSNFLLFFN